LDAVSRKKFHFRTFIAVARRRHGFALDTPLRTHRPVIAAKPCDGYF
jgi:hypothetical protein